MAENPLAKFAKAKAAKHEKGAATDLNKFSLFEHMSGEHKASNRVSPTSSAGIRRAMKAGLVEVKGSELHLTEEGKKEQATYEKKEGANRVSRAEGEISMWKNIHKLAEERGDAGEATKAKANITKHEGALEHAKGRHAKFSGAKPEFDAKADAAAYAKENPSKGYADMGSTAGAVKAAEAYEKKHGGPAPGFEGNYDDKGKWKGPQGDIAKAKERYAAKDKEQAAEGAKNLMENELRMRLISSGITVQGKNFKPTSVKFDGDDIVIKAGGQGGLPPGGSLSLSRADVEKALSTGRDVWQDKVSHPNPADDLTPEDKKRAWGGEKPAYKPPSDAEREAKLAKIWDPKNAPAKAPEGNADDAWAKKTPAGEDKHASTKAEIAKLNEKMDKIYADAPSDEEGKNLDTMIEGGGGDSARSAMKALRKQRDDLERSMKEKPAEKISTEEKKADPKLNKLMQAHDDAYMRAKYSGSEAEKRQGEADLAEHKAKISAHVQAAHKEDAAEPKAAVLNALYGGSKELYEKGPAQKAPGSSDASNLLIQGKSNANQSRSLYLKGKGEEAEMGKKLKAGMQAEEKKYQQQKQGQSIQTGAKGGRYYVNASGTKVYVK